SRPRAKSASGWRREHPGTRRFSTDPVDGRSRTRLRTPAGRGDGRATAGEEWDGGVGARGPMDSTSETHADERVLVLTPSGRDADLMSAVIAQVGLVYEPCTDVGALCHAIAAGATGVVVPAEVLTPPVIARLHRQLEAEPAWSDL